MLLICRLSLSTSPSLITGFSSLFVNNDCFIKKISYSALDLENLYSSQHFPQTIIQSVNIAVKMALTSTRLCLLLL